MADRPGSPDLTHGQPAELAGLTWPPERRPNLPTTAAPQAPSRWTVALHPDGTTTARSPDGTKIFHSHGPPPARAG